MKRGTTPTIEITLEDCEDATQFKTVFVTLKQFPNTVIEKTGKELTITSNSVTIMLTQEETLAFKPGEVLLQVRTLDHNDIASASNIITLQAERILKDGVIS